MEHAGAVPGCMMLVSARPGVAHRNGCLILFVDPSPRPAAQDRGASSHGALASQTTQIRRVIMTNLDASRRLLAAAREGASISREGG